MKYYTRTLQIADILKKKSYFLFGPRQTGKSTLIRETLGNCRIYNLNDSKLYRELSKSPEILNQRLTDKDKIVVIDEIQRIPLLLNEVQIAIDEKNIHFLLTGSSARKLRRGGVNLLGGRARERQLFPLTSFELGQDFDLLKAINFGTIPSIYFSDSPDEDLEAYCGHYLELEIAAEGLARSIPAFSRFLEVAALTSGEMLNYEAVSNDAQVPKTTVYEYYQILRDTLIADDLPAWKHTIKRKPIKSSKFYFFDTGVVRTLRQQSQVKLKSPQFGHLLETYIHHELKAYLSYTNSKGLCYWRSTSNFEVDFILEDRIAIEVKAKSNISKKDLKGLQALQEEQLLESYIVVCLEEEPRIVDNIHILPLRIFLDRLWKEGLP